MAHCRNQSTLLAFTVPKGFKPGDGVSIVATHVDSPNLKVIIGLIMVTFPGLTSSLQVRPVSKKSSAGYLQVGVEMYVIINTNNFIIQPNI